MEKRVVKIKESQLNDIIKKVIKEQEAQVMTTGPSPEQITGIPDDGASAADTEPNFEQFISCAKELMDQGVTVGNLVDKLLDAEEEGEGETEEMPDTSVEGGTEPQNPMA